MENVSWAPAAARQMRAELEKMKELRLCETEVLLCGALNQTSEAQMDALGGGALRGISRNKPQLFSYR